MNPLAYPPGHENGPIASNCSCVTIVCVSIVCSLLVSGREPFPTFYVHSITVIHHCQYLLACIGDIRVHSRIMVCMDGHEFERRVKTLDMPAPRLMARLGISRMTFYRWRRDGVPADRVQLVDLALRYLALEQSALREVTRDA
jgi:hypothetical protein